MEFLQTRLKPLSLFLAACLLPACTRPPEDSLPTATERASLAQEAAAASRMETAMRTQTARNTGARQERETPGEFAQCHYDAERKSLELQIQSLQTKINRRRSHGWTDPQLRVANRNLEELHRQLRDLTAPLR